MTQKANTNANANTVEKITGYKVGQVLYAASAELDKGTTTPPPRYTESMLIRDMENAVRFIRGSEHQELIRESGIGTARTRGPMLSALMRRKLLIGKRGNVIVSSDMARTMVSKVPSYLKSIETTAGWELLLKQIEEGKLDEPTVVKALADQTARIVALAKKQLPK